MSMTSLPECHHSQKIHLHRDGVDKAPASGGAVAEATANTLIEMRCKTNPERERLHTTLEYRSRILDRGGTPGPLKMIGIPQAMQGFTDVPTTMNDNVTIPPAPVPWTKT